MTTQRRPGRPQIADPDAIARAAVALFSTHGYEAVTMDDVASISNVSRRTLFRHFASKADLVWRDFFATYARLSDRVESEPLEPGLAGLRALIRDGLVVDEAHQDHARVCLQIIGASPEVFAAGVGGLAEVVAGLRAHFAQGSEDGGGLEAFVAAQAAVAAMLAASVWWAQHSSEEPLVDVIDRALAALESGIG